MTVVQRPPAAYARGDIYLSDLDPVEGSEQGGTRPVVIVSNDDFSISPVRTVVPATTKEYVGEPAYVVKVHPHQTGLDHISWVLANQARTVAVSRLRRRLGRAAPEVMASIDAALRYALDLEA
jgi:mRNA interferase MazF